MAPTPLPALDCTLEQARAWVEGDLLTVSTGWFSRCWQWTGRGFSTVWVQSYVLPTAAALSVAPVCDWELPDGRACPPAQLLHLSAAIDDDEGFTSRHLAVQAVLAYPEAGLEVKFVIWVYPESPGLRTALFVRSVGAATSAAPAEAVPTEARIEHIPVTDLADSRTWIGYFNDTQNRNETHLHILKEELVAHPLQGDEYYGWASIACLGREFGGVALVKESHKCVNQPGHVTGGFVCSETAGLQCTGWGLLPGEIRADEWTPAWATWTIAWRGVDVRHRQLAIKLFERIRYPAQPERDVYVQANTWGSGGTGAESRLATREANLLAELESCAELGIDILQVDDGWQVPPGAPQWEPGERGWRPHPETLPGGWAPVRARAEELGVRLGLWAAAVPISLEELRQNRAEGGFCQFKLDFAHLTSREQIDLLTAKVRQLSAENGHQVRVNWDVTEIAPRFGYFFAREYGSLYLANRKPRLPRSTVYRPHTMLRDVWQLAHYLNPQRIQLTIQDVAAVDPRRSDAHLHSQAYAIAIALVGIPLFFMETQRLPGPAREEVRQLLAVYREHRVAMHQGIVCPLGDCPDNASWTGFQSHDLETESGYMLIFRERCNQDARQAIPLPITPQAAARWSDVLTGARIKMPRTIGPEFHIPDAPGFLWLRYEVG